MRGAQKGPPAHFSKGGPPDVGKGAPPGFGKGIPPDHGKGAPPEYGIGRPPEGDPSGALGWAISIVGALVVWLGAAALIYGIARIVCRARVHGRVLLTGLGYAATPMAI